MNVIDERCSKSVLLFILNPCTQVQSFALL